MENKYVSNNKNTESKAKRFWKGFGIVALSLVLAVLTITVINL